MLLVSVVSYYLVSIISYFFGFQWFRIFLALDSFVFFLVSIVSLVIILTIIINPVPSFPGMDQVHKTSDIILRIVCIFLFFFCHMRNHTKHCQRNNSRPEKSSLETLEEKKNK